MKYQNFKLNKIMSTTNSKLREFLTGGSLERYLPFTKVEDSAFISYHKWFMKKGDTEATIYFSKSGVHGTAIVVIKRTIMDTFTFEYRFDTDKIVPFLSFLSILKNPMDIHVTCKESVQVAKDFFQALRKAKEKEALKRKELEESQSYIIPEEVQNRIREALVEGREGLSIPLYINPYYGSTQEAVFFLPFGERQLLVNKLRSLGYDARLDVGSGFLSKVDLIIKL